jgi:SAM-dependent methyltransferase
MSDYDAIADRYDEHFGRPVDHWEDDRLAALLSPLVDGRDVLDLGCGTGWLLDHCHPRRYTGVDESSAMVLRLLDKHADSGRIIHTIKARIGEPGWQRSVLPARFDVVTATWSLQYLGDLTALLTGLACFDPEVIALHGYLPRYRHRGHEITGTEPPVIEPGEIRAATRAAGLPQPVMHGTGSLPDALARTRAGWDMAASLTPPEWHLAALWVWRPDG